MLYFGIIDILQPYNAAKRLEAGLKGLVRPTGSVSVTHPRAYASRFQTFMERRVFG